MPVNENVIWSERADLEYNKLIDYLLTNWGLTITEEIIEKVTIAINRIAASPNQFPVSVKSKQIHKCVVTKQTSLFFKVIKKKIIIISVFDNRQNPKKRPRS
jgi:plasmid stabilization system protein ParE